MDDRSIGAQCALKYEKITKLLIEKKLTITTMESCTSGTVASLITDTEGSSAVMKGAYVTYSNQAKVMCGVPENIISEYGVYSMETAAAMAKAAMNSYQADIAIGVTGSFANVDPNNADSQPNVVYYCVRVGNEDKTQIIQGFAANGRKEAKLYVANVIADSLLDVLEK